MKEIHVAPYNVDLKYPDDWNYEAMATTPDHIELQFDKQTVAVYPGGRTENLGLKPFIKVVEDIVTDTEITDTPDELLPEPEPEPESELEPPEEISDVKMDKRRKK